MNNKAKALDIYLMGIGGTAMGAFAGLLKQKGHRVRGSDLALYSPMKEKLIEWGIECKTPYQAENVEPRPDLVVVGNVIRRDNVEASHVREENIAHDSFPSTLNKLFLKNAKPIVASGTHGKTTCSAILAHTLFNAGFDPGFLIGGIPLNFKESFRVSTLENYPFVIEGDEYDTAYFDKRPKFVHYDPKFLLVTSLEFDHGDIYKNLDSIILVFSNLFSSMSAQDTAVINSDDENILTALKNSHSKAKIFTYGSSGDYTVRDIKLNKQSTDFNIYFRDKFLGQVISPLFGEHNVKNILGCYAILHNYGLNHEQIAAGFASFAGVKRRLEEKTNKNGIVVVDDFAHHPSAVLETIKACRQKYAEYQIWAIFEPRSATTCTNIFKSHYEKAFLGADRVFLAPIGRSMNTDKLDTDGIADELNKNGVYARAYKTYEDLKKDLSQPKTSVVLLFMSNGDFSGLLNEIEQIIF